jgi:hypothetical protein
MNSGTTSTLLPVPFIVGQHRSGTTLLRLMLDSHPDLAIPPETQFIPEAIRSCQSAPDPAERFLQTLTSHDHWGDFHVDAAALRRVLAGMCPFDLSEALRAFYRLYAARHGKRRWGDKTPRYVLAMELIQQYFPEAHFIHIIRDGRDLALSVLEEPRGSKAPPSVRHIGERWAVKVTEARQQATRLRFYLEVRYEDLVLNTDPTLRKVCDSIDLTWNVAMLGYYRRAEERLSEEVTVGPKGIPVEQRHQKHRWTTKPPEASRVGRWRREMKPHDRDEFERAAGAMLQELGYDRG